MNGLKFQESFRWVTPIMLCLLSALLGVYLVLLQGWQNELKEIKACAADFESEVREMYMPRKELAVYFMGINDSLKEIKEKLEKL